MKLTNLRAFEKHVQGAAPNHFSSLYLILGKEAFQRKTAVDKLVLALKNSSPKNESELTIMEGERLSSKDLIQELNALALFATRRAVLVENADELDKETLVALDKYFENPTPSLYLVLSASSFHHGTNFYKKCEKIGIVLEFVEEKSWEKERVTQEWIHSVVSAEGMSIDSACSLHLVKLLGTQQEVLHGELQKLFCYLGTRTQITLQDISAIISPLPLDNSWQLGEAIFRRDGSTALRICKGLLQEETPFFMLIRQLRFQFQTEFQVCSIIANGGGAAEISSQFAYMKGAILERHMALAQGYGLQNFKLGLLKIDETELQAKNSGLDTSFLAELLIVKLTSRIYRES